MLSRLTRYQLVAFVIVTVVTVGYSAGAYLDVPRLLGLSRYAITVNLPSGGNLYEQSIATLRGVPVGRVLDVRPSPTGVTAEVQLEERAQIPHAATADVRSVSAAGEQYLNFEAPDSTGPYYTDGAVFPANRVSIPVDTARLLNNVNQLVATLPKNDLNTTVREAGTAFSGSGKDLQRLLDALLPLQHEFTANLAPTVQLINDLQPVLGTQDLVSPQIRAWAGNTSSFTDRLQRADPDLRGTLDKVPPLAHEATRLIDDLQSTVPVLLRDLTQVGQVVRVYNPAVAHTLTLLPAAANGLQSALNGSKIPGAVNLHLMTALDDPPACVPGFLQNRRDPADLTPTAPPTDVGCKSPPAQPDQAVRGARNYPCPTQPWRRAPSAAECGLQFQRPEEVAESQRRAIATQLDRAKTNPKTEAEERAEDAKSPRPETQATTPDAGPYDPSTGLATPATSPPVIVGDTLPDPVDGWQGMLLTPLGLTP